jgi:sugar fermentation stimulation protein A
MKFSEPLVRGTLVKRYKRFLSDIQLSDGELVVAHCANPGAMLGLNTAGAEVWLSRSRNPARKLAYSWELVRVGEHLVGINTGLPNAIVAEAVQAGKIKELRGYDTIRREVRYGVNSRIDLLLDAPGKPTCYVEIKNVHLKRGPAAEFPDCPTVRGAKHLRELAEMVALGYRAVMVYLVQRGDCDYFTVADDLDPAYGRAFREALQRGVEAICYTCKVTVDAIEIGRALPVRLPDRPLLKIAK